MLQRPGDTVRDYRRHGRPTSIIGTTSDFIELPIISRAAGGPVPWLSKMRW